MFVRLALGASILAISSVSTSAQTVPSSARVGERPCSVQRSIRAQHSREKTTITFVNRATTYRGLYWINAARKEQSAGGLNPGETKTFNTFRTHPWVVTTGPGDCLRVYLPAAEPGRVILR